jgi:hypothetical protein
MANDFEKKITRRYFIKLFFVLLKEIHDNDTKYRVIKFFFLIEINSNEGIHKDIFKS